MTKTKTECMKAGNLVKWSLYDDDSYGVLVQMANGNIFVYFPDSESYANIESEGIVEVRYPHCSYPVPLFNDTKVQWERSFPVWKKTPPVVELTMDEIANKFGIPVQQLKIKK